MADKAPNDQTPTELFAKENYGAEPGPPPVYDRFRQAVNGAYASNKTAVDKAAEGVEDTLSKLQQWRNQTQTGKWLTGPVLTNALTAPAAAIMGPTALGYGAGQALGQAIKGRPDQPTATPVPDQTGGQVTSPGGSFVRPSEAGTPVDQLPSAPLKPAMGPGMGPGGDIYGGVGTQKALMGSQLDYLGDLGGLQEKKGEEYVAHLKGMSTAADLQQEAADQMRVGAKAYQDKINDIDHGLMEQESSAQKAADEAASKGIDPGRYYKNRNLGFWINMAIGGIASGMLSAMQGRGGENPFMDSIRGMVQDDIKSQEMDISQGWKRSQSSQTAYERARMRGVDQATAAHKQYDWTLQALETEMKGRLMKSQIPEEQKRLEGALQQLQIERDKAATEFQSSWLARREQAARAAAAAAVAARNAERQARLDAQEWEVKKSQIAKNYSEAEKERGARTKEQIEADKSARLYQVHTNFLTAPETTGLANAPGSTTSKAGVQYLPMQTDARKYTQQLDQYNSEADTILGHWLKDESGRVPVEEYRQQAHRFELTPLMTAEEKTARIKALKSWVDERAKTSGVIQPDAKPSQFGSTAPSFQPKKE